jgi:hypothetical protein
MSASGRIGLVSVTGPGSSTSLRDFARTGLTAFLRPALAAVIGWSAIFRATPQQIKVTYFTAQIEIA